MEWSGWNLIFLYGILLTSYSLAQVLFRRFRFLEELIISGELDTYFLKPQSIIYSLVFCNLGIVEIFSQLLPSCIVLFLACIHNDIDWCFIKILVLFGTVIGGTVIQITIFWLIGCVAFWTIKSSDLSTIFFAFKEFLNYPLCIYGKKVLAFLTYIFPLAFINYYPSLYLLNRDISIQIKSFMTLPVAIILLLITYIVWKISLRHYNSTGN